MRAFIGMALPQEVRESLGALQRELAKTGGDVKWVEPKNLHLTLKFLGEMSEEQCQTLEQILKTVAQHHAACSLSLGALGAFPTLNAPRVIWVDVVEGKQAVEELAQAIEQASRTVGLIGEARPFAAHITLGRVRSPRGHEALVNALRFISWQPPSAWRADRISLYQSRLGSGGPTYTVLTDVPLRDTA